MIECLGHYLRTTRHLLPSQLGWRLLGRLERLGIMQAALPQYSVPLDHEALALFAESGTPVPIDVEALRRGQIRLLNEIHTVGFPEPDWQPPNPSTRRLWTMTLHYHEWLHTALVHAIAADDRTLQQELVRCFRHWIISWPSSLAYSGCFAWSPYAISSRALVWLRCVQAIHQSNSPVLLPLVPELASSLFTQAAFLSTHLELDILGNHLIHNLTGLLCSARTLRGPQSEGWINRACTLMERELERQILPDGGHVERTTLYHQRVLNDLVLFRRFCPRSQLMVKLDDRIAAMQTFAAWTCHATGVPFQLNDADPTEVPPPATSPKGLLWLRDTGWIVWRHLDNSLVFDAGPIGPDYQPGHAHADTLSIELTAAGHPLIVDPGTCHYDVGATRDYDRSTAAHNTVTIDRTNSSEVWHNFRVGRRARPRFVSVNGDEFNWAASASHDGYDWLPNSPRHTRTLKYQEHVLTIIDDIDGKGEHHLAAHFLCHPEWKLRNTPSGWDVVHDSGLTLALAVTLPSGLLKTNAPRTYHPGFAIERRVDSFGWEGTAILPCRIELRISPLT